jgi:hypothetical protein
MNNRSLHGFLMASTIVLFYIQPGFAAPAAPTLNLPAAGSTYDTTSNYFSWSASGIVNSRIVISSDPNFKNFVDSAGNSYCTDMSNCFTTTTGYNQYFKGNVPLGGPLYWKVRYSTATEASSFSAPRKVFVNPCTMTGAPRYSRQTVGSTYVFQVNLCQSADLRAYTATQNTSVYVSSCADQSRRAYRFDNAQNIAGYRARQDLSGKSVVLSGSFGSNTGTSGYPSFPLLVNGNLLTYGDNRCQSGAKKSLIINHSQKRAAVEDFLVENVEAKKGLTNYTVVIGFDSTKLVGATTAGRNFACVTNPYNTAFGTVIFALATSSTNADLNRLLTDTYGCNSSQIVQFDGSGSAQVSEKLNNTWTDLLKGDSRKVIQGFSVQ